MPARNTAQYIGQAIESALDQTTTNFELVIVDDQSEDDTAGIAMAYAARDPRIRVVPGPGRGVSAARNVALAVARAPMFALLDSDDMVAPNYLEEQLATFAREPNAAIVTANAVNLGGPLNGQPFRSIEGGCQKLSLADILAFEDVVFITSASILRRVVFDSIGGFNEQMMTNEDYDFWIRAAAAGFEIIQNPRPLALYRRRPYSLSADELRMLNGIVRVLEGNRSLCGAAERTIVDRQLARFDRERLELEAKVALRRRDFQIAAERFKTLYSRHPAVRPALVAAASCYAPSALFWFDRFVTAVRPLRRARRFLGDAECNALSSF
jgi:glycosyltransferase involved in cell wall biosynthesis